MAMKAIMVALIVYANALLFGAVANAQAMPEHRCTNAVLKGSYGLLVTGFDAAGNARNSVGVVTFDGKGGWSLGVTEVHKEGEAQHITNSNGTYSVNPDCRGSASLETKAMGVAKWEFVIVDDGKEILQIRTGATPETTAPHGTTTWLLKKQFSR